MATLPPPKPSSSKSTDVPSHTHAHSHEPLRVYRSFKDAPLQSTKFGHCRASLLSRTSSTFPHMFSSRPHWYLCTVAIPDQRGRHFRAPEPESPGKGLQKTSLQASKAGCRLNCELDKRDLTVCGVQCLQSPLRAGCAHGVPREAIRRRLFV